MLILRNILEILLNPFDLTMILLALFILLLWFKGNVLWIRLGLLFSFILLFIISLGLLPQRLTRFLEDSYPIVAHPSSEIHWVVVLSGGQAEVQDKPIHVQLYSASIKRLIEGIRLYKHLSNAKLLLSGGGYLSNTKEAVNLEKLASWFNIPKEDIVLETTSLNTYEEARAIKRIIKDNPFYLVTSAIHLPRSMFIFQSAGMRPLAAPTDFTYYWNDARWPKYYLPNPYNLFYLSIAMHEILGLAWENLNLLAKNSK